MNRITFLLAVALATGCSDRESKPAAAPPVVASAPRPTAKDPAAAKAAIAKGATVIDVRSADEFQDDHLPTAVNIPFDEIGKRVDEVSKLVGGAKDKDIVVYCASGGRSARAKADLEKAGFTHVINGGGIDDL